MEGYGEASFLQRLDNTLHRDEWYKSLLDKIEQRTGISRVYLVLGLTFALSFNLILGFGGHLISTAIGILYPAIQTIHAIESKDKDAASRWLTYWVVFSFMNIFEAYTYFILKWIPCYWLLKSMFFVWCFAPFQNNGSVAVYNVFIRPYFVSQENAEEALKREMNTNRSVLTVQPNPQGDSQPNLRTRSQHKH